MNSSEKPDLKGMTSIELKKFMMSKNIEPYRQEQIFNWIHRHRVNSFQDMKNIPLELRTKLEEISTIGKIEILNKTEKSKDGTIKFLFKLADSKTVESVIIYPREEAVDADKRLTVCISTQIGCPLDCKFCATGTIGFIRNLSASEIVDQILLLQSIAEKPITNIVYMGMGEPMLNYENVMSSIEILTNQKGVGYSTSRITISTAGYADKIKQMGDENRKVKLALSLHSLVDEVRTEIMPITKKFSVEELLDSLEYYQSKTNKSVMFEYILFENLNDRPEDVRLLVQACRRIEARVNIIPYHSIEFTHPVGIAKNLKPTSKQRAYEFISSLRSKNILVFQRQSAGEEIEAACGQLAFTHYK